MLRIKRLLVLHWVLRLVGLGVIAGQLWMILAVLHDAAGPYGVRPVSIVESMARVVIITGYLISLRAERIGGAVMILACAVLSIAVYSWAWSLGSYGSLLMALHVLPPMAIGLLHLCLTVRPVALRRALAR